MDIPFVKGVVSKQAHVGVPDGTFEEEYARDGFFGKYAHLYRTQPLTQWDSIDGPLMPRAFDPVKLIKEDSGEDFYSSRKSFLHNNDVDIQMVNVRSPMKYYFRNADGEIGRAHV